MSRHPGQELMRADGRLPYIQQPKHGQPGQSGIGNTHNISARVVWLTAPEVRRARGRSRSSFTFTAASQAVLSAMATPARSAGEP